MNRFNESWRDEVVSHPMAEGCYDPVEFGDGDGWTEVQAILLARLLSAATPTLPLKGDWEILLDSESSTRHIVGRPDLSHSYCGYHVAWRPWNWHRQDAVCREKPYLMYEFRLALEPLYKEMATTNGGPPDLPSVVIDTGPSTGRVVPLPTRQECLTEIVRLEASGYRAHYRTPEVLPRNIRRRTASVH